MNISILSMQRVENYGSLLQSYALKKLINTISDASVFFQDIEPGICINLEAPKTSKKEKVSWGKRINNKIELWKTSKQYRKFQNKILLLDSKLSFYDLCVIGSDEVFNCGEKTPWGLSTQLFGKVSNAKRVITYAASAGNTTYENLEKNHIDIIKNAMSNLSGMSVRDNNTFDMVKKIGNIDAEMHMDPVMISDFSEEIEAYGYNKRIKGEYCIVYSYYHRFDDKTEIMDILRFCKKKKYKVYSIEGPQTWINNHLALSPFEVLSCFKNAKFVITDTFHGTIFAAKYAKKFAVYSRDSNENKLLDLIKKLKIEDHLVGKENMLDAIYTLENDSYKIKCIEKNERERTLSYLKKYVLSEGKNICMEK